MGSVLKISFLFISIALIPLLLNGQPYVSDLTTKSKKASKAFEQAREYTDQRDYTSAIKKLEDALGADPDFIEACLYLGDIYRDLGEDSSAINYYRRAFSINPSFFPPTGLILGGLELKRGLYEDAREHLAAYLSTGNPDKKRKQFVEGKIADCEFALSLMNNPVPFDPVNLGQGVNTKDDEFVNAITTDGEILILTRKLPTGTGFEGKPLLTEDFYISVLVQDSVWQKAETLGPPVNTKGNEGALCISPDGNYIYFAACNREDSRGSCDLYVSKKVGESWGKPTNLGAIVNSERWDSQPSMSSDSRTLYFSSAREGGKGGADIWMAVRDDQGAWSKPVNLGDSINTEESEMSPLIHPDGSTLYFASAGQPGMGGLDLFIARKNPAGEFSKAANLGYPINTYADELGLVVDSRGMLAYFSSDKLGGEGLYDIYSFLLAQNVRPETVSYMKGIVYDAADGSKLKAYFELTDLESGKAVVKAESNDVTGEFLVSLPANKRYALSVVKDDYLFHSENIDLIGNTSEINPFIKNIPLQRIEKGKQVVLKNVFFETNSFALLSESRIELDRLVGLLTKNPSMHIEIEGHTDNVGTMEYNMGLSAKRAKAVMDYIINNGIASSRLSYSGWGYNRPVADNDTEEGRALNRRTEFRVIEK